MVRRIKPIAERFWPKVEKTETCWLWTAAINNKGYGRMGVGRADEGNVLAHRVSYELANGPVPEGMCVLHRCDNPSCVRPDHLFLGTMSDNTRDMYRKGRDGGLIESYRSRTHCPHGHPYDYANTYHYRGSRKCRKCLGLKTLVA